MCLIARIFDAPTPISAYCKKTEARLAWDFDKVTIPCAMGREIFILIARLFTLCA